MTTIYPPKTPELDKERKAREEGHAQEIGEFLEWYRETDGMDSRRIEEVLAAYFGIDRKRAEDERRALLAYCRTTNALADAKKELGIEDKT